MQAGNAGSAQDTVVRRSKRRHAGAHFSADYETPRRKLKTRRKPREPIRLPAEIWLMIVEDCFQTMTDQELWLKVRPLNHHCKELIEIYAASCAGTNKNELKTRMESGLQTYVGYSIFDVNKYYSNWMYNTGWTLSESIWRSAAQGPGDAPALWYIPGLSPEKSLRKGKPWLYCPQLEWAGRTPDDDEVRQKGFKTHFYQRPRYNANRILRYQGIHPQHRHLAVYTFRTTRLDWRRGNFPRSEPDVPAFGMLHWVESDAVRKSELEAAVRYWKTMRERKSNRKPAGGAYSLCISVPSYEAAQAATCRHVLTSSRDYIEIVPDTAEVTLDPSTGLPMIICAIDWCKVWTLQCSREKIIEDRLTAALAQTDDESLIRNAEGLLRHHQSIGTQQDKDDTRKYTDHITNLVLKREGLRVYEHTKTGTSLYEEIRAKYFHQEP